MDAKFRTVIAFVVAPAVTACTSVAPEDPGSGADRRDAGLCPSPDGGLPDWATAADPRVPLPNQDGPYPVQVFLVNEVARCLEAVTQPLVSVCLLVSSQSSGTTQPTCLFGPAGDLFYFRAFTGSVPIGPGWRLASSASSDIERCRQALGFIADVGDGGASSRAPGPICGGEDATCSPGRALPSGVRRVFAWDTGNSCLREVTNPIAGVCLRDDNGGAKAPFCMVSPDDAMFYVLGTTADVPVGAGWRAVGGPFAGWLAGVTGASELDQTRCRELLRRVETAGLDAGSAAGADASPDAGGVPLACP